MGRIWYWLVGFFLHVWYFNERAITCLQNLKYCQLKVTDRNGNKIMSYRKFCFRKYGLKWWMICDSRLNLNFLLWLCQFVLFMFLKHLWPTRNVRILFLCYSTVYCRSTTWLMIKQKWCFRKIIWCWRKLWRNSSTMKFWRERYVSVSTVMSCIHAWWFCCSNQGHFS